MTPTRKRMLEVARLILEDSALDPSLPVGTRERLSMSAARLVTEMEAIEGLASSKNQPTVKEHQVTATQKPTSPIPERRVSKCVFSYSNHDWRNGKMCFRCGAKR